MSDPVHPTGGPAGHGDAVVTDPADDRRRFTRVAATAIAVAAVPFLAVLSGFSGDLFRTALPDGSNSDFYDIQARALLDGHLEVPTGSLGPEAFVVDGDHFMYFPPFPALLRIPHMLVTDELDGDVTAISILLAWVLTAVALSLLIWRIRLLLIPGRRLGRLEAWCHGMFIVVALGGSVLLHLAALPWVYHESYAWGIAGTLWALFALVGYVADPSTRGAVAVGAWTLVAVLSRSPAGWACAGATLLATAWIAAGRRGADERHAWWPLAIAGVAPVVAASAINWAKFRHPFMVPFDDQVWSEISVHRQRALDANDGSLTGLQYVPSTIVAYLRPDGIRFTSLFPYVTFPAEPPTSVNGARFDETYRTGSVTAFMPGMLLLSVWGAIAVCRDRVPTAARGLRIALLGAATVPVGVLSFGYIAPRYTAEFFVLLAVGGAIGVVDLARRVDALDRSVGYGVGAVALLAVCFGLAANLAASFQVQSIEARGDALERYLRLQHTASAATADPLHGYIVRSNVPPADAAADQLWVHGSCDGLFLATGNTYRPWLPVESADIVVEVTLPADDVDGDPLIAFTPPGPAIGVDSRSGDAGREARLAIDIGEGTITTPWFPAPADTFEMALLSDVETERHTVIAPAGEPLEVPMAVWVDSIVRPVVVDASTSADRPPTQGQVGLRRRTGDRPSLCDEIVPAGPS